MLKDKSTFGRFPLKITVKLRKRNIYLKPQGWGTWDSLSSVRYQTNGIHKLSHYLIPTSYNFSWLWLDVFFELRKDFMSEQKVYQEPVKEVYGKEII